jgi:NAD(P)-dependent dehydrogenase (short-subunit alcohol dehydrogenase family)
VPVLDCFKLDGKVAVVTGASGGLGRTFATALASAGADVVVGARRASGLEETKAIVEGLGRRGVSVPTDVSRRDQCENLVEAAFTELGRVDILVNNAGVGSPVPALKEDPDEFTRVIEVNLSGCHWMSCAAAERMKPGSSIINISSVLATVSAGIPQAAYAASKAGVMGLTRDLAHQWSGRRGIRVNAILPGFFETDLTTDHGGFDRLLDRIAVGRIGEPEDLLGALILLASDGSRYMTGQSIVVDGGFTAG